MHKHLYRIVCGLTGMVVLGGCQSESVRDKAEKVNETTKSSISMYWPAGVPQPADLTVGPGGDIDLQKMDLLQFWPKKSDADTSADESQWREMIMGADETLMSGRPEEASQQYDAAEKFAREKFGNEDPHRLIAHFGQAKVHTVRMKMDDALAAARETLELAEKATPRDETLISEIKGDIEKIEAAKAKHSGSATKDN